MDASQTRPSDAESGASLRAASPGLSKRLIVGGVAVGPFNLPSGTSLDQLLQDGANLLAAGASTTVGLIVAGIVQHEIDAWLTHRRWQSRAALLLRELFGSLDGTRLFDMFLGRPTYGPAHDSYHPYHLPASLSVGLGLGAFDRPTVRQSGQLPLPMQFRGDLVLVGGPNASPPGAAVLGMSGPRHDRLRLTGDSLVPVRWVGVADRTHPEIPRGVRVTYGMGRQTPANTHPWPMEDLFDDARRYRHVSIGAAVPGVDGLYLPETNFLLLTRMPNFLDPDFPTWMQTKRHRSTWPRMVIVDGTHGPGTLAVELLRSAQGAEFLREIELQVRDSDSFQALLTVSDLHPRRGGLHEFRRIRYVETQTMDVDSEVYLDAHRRAWRQLEDWASPSSWASLPFVPTP